MFYNSLKDKIYSLAYGCFCFFFNFGSTVDFKLKGEQKKDTVLMTNLL